MLDLRHNEIPDYSKPTLRVLAFAIAVTAAVNVVSTSCVSSLEPSRKSIEFKIFLVPKQLPYGKRERGIELLLNVVFREESVHWVNSTNSDIQLSYSAPPSKFVQRI